MIKNKENNPKYQRNYYKVHRKWENTNYWTIQVSFFVKIFVVVKKWQQNDMILAKLDCKKTHVTIIKIYQIKKK